MLFIGTNIILACISVGFGFVLNGLGNRYRHLLQDINSTLTSFDTSSIKIKWIEQPLDHFDKKNINTWNMRYMERLDKWKKDGPIYLFMYGEGEASQVFLQTGILYELAEETNGAMLLSEHRYYGKSKPFEELTTENLKFLSSRQALADTARLLELVKSEPQYENSKIVVVGGSYAGNLAAWMRLLYPNLINAAIASSAPVLAKKDFYEYLEHVSDDFEQHGTEDCMEKINEIFTTYEKRFRTVDGIKQLKKEEYICEDTDMTKVENQQLFFLDKSSAFMYIAQYGNPDVIKTYCEDIKNTSLVFSSKVDENDFYDTKNNCYDYEFEEMIQNTKEIDWLVSWTYQTCTEFSYFPSTSSNKHPFTDNISMDLFYKMCTKTFGPNFDEKRIEAGVMETNMMYGGLTPNVTKVVFVNGDLDPYHRLSILEDLSYEAPAKVIPRTSHCRDLFSNRSGDPEELIEARYYIKYLIKKWIGLGDYNKPNEIKHTT
uniref:Serine protease K12H4.7 n=2 Tax=Bombyx mori TaxID=7091 RepID=A0A8R1WMJ5_BOMMO|nr:putative serine protease K12H4.7 [Bombyx mori]